MQPIANSQSQRFSHILCSIKITKNLLISAGIGKTTVCKKVASTLEKKGVRFDGFYTEEVRNQSGYRIGFDVVRVSDPEKRSSLSRLKCVRVCFATMTMTKLCITECILYIYIYVYI